MTSVEIMLVLSFVFLFAMPAIALVTPHRTGRGD